MHPEAGRGVGPGAGRGVRRPPGERRSDSCGCDPVRDRDGKYASPFDEALRAAGVDVRKTPVRRPNMVAFIERWGQSLRVECLDRMLALGETHLDHIIQSYGDYYYHLLPHQSPGNRPLPDAGEPEPPIPPFPEWRRRLRATPRRPPPALPPGGVSRVPAGNSSTRRARTAPSPEIGRQLSRSVPRIDRLHMIHHRNVDRSAKSQTAMSTILHRTGPDKLQDKSCGVGRHGSDPDESPVVNSRELSSFFTGTPRTVPLHCSQLRSCVNARILHSSRWPTDTTSRSPSGPRT